MALIRELAIGNTQIYFYDDACGDTSEERRQQIIQRIALRTRAELANGPSSPSIPDKTASEAFKW